MGRLSAEIRRQAWPAANQASAQRLWLALVIESAFSAYSSFGAYFPPITKHEAGGGKQNLIILRKQRTYLSALALCMW
jgi:hypothetical protein